MKKTTPVIEVLVTNCTIVEAMADSRTIEEIFVRFPNRFLPVVEGLRFIGVILRDEFHQITRSGAAAGLDAKSLVSKEMVMLDTHNTIEEAKEVFDTNVFEMLPVTDGDGDLAGILLRDDIEAAWLKASQGNLLQRVVSLRRSFSFLVP